MTVPSAGAPDDADVARALGLPESLSAEDQARLLRQGTDRRWIARLGWARAHLPPGDLRRRALQHRLVVVSRIGLTAAAVMAIHVLVLVAEGSPQTEREWFLVALSLLVVGAGITGPAISLMLVRMAERAAARRDPPAPDRRSA